MDWIDGIGWISGWGIEHLYIKLTGIKGKHCFPLMVWISNNNKICPAGWCWLMETFHNPTFLSGSNDDHGTPIHYFHQLSLLSFSRFSFHFFFCLAIVVSISIISIISMMASNSFSVLLWWWLLFPWILWWPLFLFLSCYDGWMKGGRFSLMVHQ